MKKFVFPFCFILLFSVFFAACDNSQQNHSEEYVSDWVEVQSIAYYINPYGSSYPISYTSYYEWDYSRSSVTQEEFCSATDISPEEINTISTGEFLASNDLPSSIKAKNELISSLNQRKGETSYYKTNNNYFYKVLVTNYTIYYVQIRFFTDGSLSIKYKDDTRRVKPISYSITYFAD